MATRSTIAIEHADGTIQQVYCHWDGYLDNNGRILAECYSDPAKLQPLIDLGDLSVLGKEIGEKHQFADAAGYKGCTFYGRDRGEAGVQARQYNDFQDYRDRAQFEEYNYILRRDGTWLVEYYGTNGRYAPLEQTLAEMAALED